MRNIQPLPVHLQCDGAVDDGEAEHPDPAEQDAPEGARLEVQDENLQRGERGTGLCKSQQQQRGRRHFSICTDTLDIQSRGRKDRHMEFLSYVYLLNITISP